MSREPFPVLLYHSVHDAGGDRWAVTPSAFAEHVRALVASGRTPVTVATLAAGLRGDVRLPARPVAVTFDDGFADNLRALELLHAAGVPATLFVTAGWVGRRGMVTATDLRALAAAEHVELGAHAIRHRRLDELDAAAVRDEVDGSRERLEQLTGMPVTSFAYPHGAYDRRVRAAVLDAGYTAAAAVRNRCSHPADDPYAIARWTVTRDTPAARVAEVLAGRGLAAAPRRELLRTTSWRAARRAWQRVAPQGAVPS